MLALCFVSFPLATSEILGWKARSLGLLGTDAHRFILSLTKWKPSHPFLEGEIFAEAPGSPFLSVLL